MTATRTKRVVTRARAARRSSSRRPRHRILRARDLNQGGALRQRGAPSSQPRTGSPCAPRLRYCLTRLAEGPLHGPKTPSRTPAPPRGGESSELGSPQFMVHGGNQNKAGGDVGQGYSTV